jgi:8-oxo-dGTP pyrophosphatase MutT (NUDIX family)
LDFSKGHIESGETAEDAALREVREEAGVEGDLIAYVGSLEFESGAEYVLVDYYLMTVELQTGLEPLIT